MLNDRTAKLKRLLMLQAVNEDVEVFRNDRKHCSFEFINNGINKLRGNEVQSFRRRQGFGGQANLKAEDCEDRSLKSEAGSRKSEVRSQKSEDGNLTLRQSSGLTSDVRPLTSVTLKLKAHSKHLDKMLEMVDEFYKKADERDSAMLDNLLKKMDERGQRIGVLVAGGYHSSGITRLMRERGISYITVRPEINDMREDASFNNRMLGHVAPFDHEYKGSFELSQITASFSELNPEEFGRFLDQAGILIKGQYVLDNLKTPQEVLKQIALMREKYENDEEMTRLADALQSIVETLAPIIEKAADEGKTLKDQAEMIMAAFGEKLSQDKSLRDKIGRTVKDQESLIEYLDNVRNRFFELLGLNNLYDETDAMSLVVRDVLSRIPPAPPLKLIYRTGKTSQQTLIEKIQEIVESHEDIDYIMEAVFKEFCDIKEEKLNLIEGMLYKRCTWELNEIVTTVKLHKKFDPALLDILRELICDTAVLIRKYVKYSKRIVDHLYLFLSYIDTEMVLRDMADGRVIIPSRYDPPYELTQEEIEINGLQDLFQFTRKVRDKVRLRRVFDRNFYERYSRIGMSDGEIGRYRDSLIEKLINETAFDIVRERASLVRGNAGACSRIGSTPRGTGIWIGEFVVRDFMEMDDEEGLDLFAEVLFEEAQHFGIKKFRHGFLMNIKDFGNVIEHRNEWGMRFDKQLDRLDAGINERRQPDEDKKKRIVSMEKIKKIAPREFTINPYPQRKEEASSEILITKIQSILSQDKELEQIQKDIFRAIIDVDEITDVQEELYKRCKIVLELWIKLMKRNFRESYLEHIKESITNIASDILLIEQPGNRTMGNLLIFMNYIDRAIALRITHDNRALVPGRVDPPYELSQDEIDEHDVRPLIEFISKARDKELLKRIFDKKLYDRYKQIDWSDERIYQERDALIDKLLNQASIDLIRGRASFCTGLFAMHPRRGFSNPERGPGIWVGELTVRALIEEGQKGLEFFAQLMLEDAQHFLAQSPFHSKLMKCEDGTTNYGLVIEHDEEFWQMLETLVIDIETAIKQKSIELTEEEIEQLLKNGEELTDEEIIEIRKNGIALNEVELTMNRIAEKIKAREESEKKMEETETDAMERYAFKGDVVSEEITELPFIELSLMNEEELKQTGNDLNNTLLDALIDPNKSSVIPRIQAGNIYTQNQQKAEKFLNLLKQNGLTPVFVLDNKIPDNMKLVIRKMIESMSIMHCTTDEYDPWIYGNHFVLYVGTTQENIPQRIDRKKERVNILLGKNLSDTKRVLAAIYFDFARIVMMARGINKSGEIITSPVTLNLSDIFPNIDNLNEKSIEFLNKVDSILRARVFRVAA